MAARSGSAGDVLAILREGSPRTRSELAALTGQARSTVGQRLQELIAAGLVGETLRTSTGGRPSTAYTFLGRSQVVLAADIGVHHAVLAVTTLRAEVLEHWAGPIDIGDGPQLVVPLVIERFTDLLAQAGRGVDDVAGVGIGLPGPVEFETGRLISPPIMPGWDGYDVVGAFTGRFHCPTLVDNDANVLAIGEQSSRWPDVKNFIYLKIGAGIGAGIIVNGEVCRGARGAAGDIGHVYTSMAEDRPCRCGNRGCVEAFAGGQSLANALAERGLPAHTPDDVVALAKAGNLETTHLLREAGRAVGSVLAACIALLNPEVIVLGGEIAEIGEPVIAGVRESVYRRALPMASQHLQVVQASGNGLEGVVGAARLVLAEVLNPEAVQHTLSVLAAVND
jgi:predicted NBD/HSP70 family sugar kinase